MKITPQQKPKIGLMKIPIIHFYLFLLMALITTSLSSQTGMKISEGKTISCPAGSLEAHSRHGLESITTNIGSILDREPTAEFAVTLGDNLAANPDAVNAFQFALNILSREIASSVPIRVFAETRPIGGAVLAAATPTHFIANFPGAPEPFVDYPAALANTLAGRILDPSQTFDIIVDINSNFDFFLGTDGNTPEGQFDFVSLILHEMLHGLGSISSSAPAINGLTVRSSLSGLPNIYTSLIINSNNSNVVNLPDPSLEILNFFTGNNVFASGANAKQALSGNRPRIHAPSNFVQGATASHWDEDTFPTGDPNSLMTPIMNPSESIFNIGDITRGMLKDMGWQLGNPQTFALVVDSPTGEFVATQGSIITQNVRIQNVSDAPFTYTASLLNNPNNLNITLNNAVDITLQPGEETNISITFNTDELELGEFMTTLKVSTNVDAAPQKRQLRIAVVEGNNAPIISTVERIEETLDLLLDNTLSNTFEIANTGNGALSYMISVTHESDSFIEISTPEGVIFSNDTAKIAYTINTDGLPEGVFNATLTISSNANNAPVLNIPVQLNNLDLPKPTFESNLGELINVFIDVDTRSPGAIVSFEVTNTGELPLEFDLPTTSDEFLIIDGAGTNAIVQPGETVIESFRIAPNIAATGTLINDEVIFFTNDPLLTQVIIPLNVTLSRERGELSFRNPEAFEPTITIGVSETRVLEFENLGPAPIVIEDVVSSRRNTEIVSTSLPNGSTLGIGDILEVTTRFSPGNTNPGATPTGTVRISHNGTSNSNQLNNDFDFSSTLVAPVALQVSETLISRVLNLSGNNEIEPITQEVTLTNNGDDTLDFSLTLNDPTDTVVAINITDGTLTPGESRVFTVTLTAPSQELGIFENEILINVNGIETPDARIATRLEVIRAAGIFADPVIVDIFAEDNFAAAVIDIQNIGDAPINVSDVVSEQEFDFTDIFLQVDGLAVTQDIAVVQPQAILTISFELEVDNPEDLVNTDIIVTSDAQNPELRIPLIFVEEAPAGVGIFADPVIVDIFSEDNF
ncbi:hypothetical protein ACKGJY_04055, partial [Hyunsoonleella sp. 2307UL5-6]|uniref:Ig-like domain-containing protein n=1 Tax=Hyunsoonleella sp. 2307UL5-6 TaxID=3384768 RepID=UPI0039BD3D33